MRHESGNQPAVKRILIVLAVAAALVAVAAIRHVRDQAEHRRLLDEMQTAERAGLDDLHLDLPELDASSWVRSYRPGKSEAGYNLVLYRRRVPMLIDMNGRIVHAWPEVRAVHRVRLSRAGDLAVTGIDNLIKEYDWDGRLKWVYRLPDDGDFPHHDLIQLRNGHFLVLARSKVRDTDYLQEVDSKGRMIWEWRSVDHRGSFPTWNPDRKDPTHINSVFELPENRWFDAGDRRFRPGNILVSARHLNTIFIVDKLSGDVVWEYSRGLDYQHEASMIAKGADGEGLIMVFNNGRNNRFTYRRSLVQVIDPIRAAVVWEYGSRFFFSSVAGTVQKLPGRNALVTSSHGGRAFEITQEGEIVWEWVPPYLPMRVERVPYDHCPQLAALPSPAPVAVRPKDRRPYVDAELYAFALAFDDVRREMDGIPRRLLRSNNGCRELLVAPGVEMWIEYGLDAKRLRGREMSARFRITIESEDGVETLLDDTVTSASDPLWKGRALSLGKFTYRDVEMCMSVDTDGEVKNADKVVAWGAPIVVSKKQRPDLQRPELEITEQERKLREQQLEALGYIN
ncbi:MAG: aryl-sulfate sulfotransferase [Thermoanaerobaculales bacterium]